MKTLNKILIILLAVAGSVILWQYFNPRIETVAQKPQIVEVHTAENGITTTTVKDVAPTQTITESLSSEYVRYVEDSLKPALKEAVKNKAEIESLTRANMELKGRLTKAEKVKDSLNTYAKIWKDKYTQIVSYGGEVDSVDYAFNAAIDVATLRGKDKKTFDVVLSTPNKNMTINGVEQFIKAQSYPKYWFDWSADFSAGKDFSNSIWNARIKTEAVFFPNGKFRPYFYGQGVFYDIENQYFNKSIDRFSVEAGAGLKFRILQK